MRHSGTHKVVARTKAINPVLTEAEYCCFNTSLEAHTLASSIHQICLCQCQCQTPGGNLSPLMAYSRAESMCCRWVLWLGRGLDKRAAWPSGPKPTVSSATLTDTRSVTVQEQDGLTPPHPFSARLCSLAQDIHTHLTVAVHRHSAVVAEKSVSHNRSWIPSEHHWEAPLCAPVSSPL